MDIPSFLKDFLIFFQTNTPAAIAAGFLVIFLAYKKPKFFFTMVFLILFLFGVYYMINYISDVGTFHEKSMTQRRMAPAD